MSKKSYKQFMEEILGAPTNSTGDAIDIGNPKPLYKKIDKRSKWHTEKLYKKCKGV